MPKRRFKKCWDQERIEREKRWRKGKMDSKRKAREDIRQGLDKWEDNG